ncbi:heparan-alpha-glucosaminide N-acetyltransferase [uncultured Dysosmobacter sp.]|uniref:heparan-alpha-glucosaminide N-acetyltransferase n=1 Tax=uncultured Dysosmobacter sp. TaxID=2591384 RepID=UPI0026040501|nr:heparan-alpha-glucosaminide N-acetyltransferase [uncultured Dysosmobacter sp.]
MQTLAPAGRRAGLDTLRGVTILSMTAYHACWDLVYIFGADWPWYHGTGAYLWQQSICWTFILLSGYCWSLGRHRLRRGLLAFGGGALVSLATLLVMPEDPILFGVLTFLGSAALLLIPLERVLRRVPAWAGLGGSFGLFLLLRDVNRGFLGFEGIRLAALPAWLYHDLGTAFLGFPPEDFFSTDYFSLFPWLFLFLTGYFLYRALEGRERGRVWEWSVPVVSAMGRHSLVIYLLHQPLVYGLLLAVDRLLKI